MIYLLAPSFDFLFRKSIQSFAINKKRYANASSFCDKYAVQSAVARERDKTTVTFVITYSTPGGVLKLCTMLEDVSLQVCDVVRVVLIVDIMIHR